MSSDCAAGERRLVDSVDEAHGERAIAHLRGMLRRLGRPRGQRAETRVQAPPRRPTNAPLTGGARAPSPAGWSLCSQQTCDRNIFVNVGPMDTVAAANETP